MKPTPSKKVNQTFSIPLDVSQELHTYVKRREMSHFVSEAIRKELETKRRTCEKPISWPIRTKVNWMQQRIGKKRSATDLMSGKNDFPKRGEIYWVNLDPAMGGES